MTYFTSPKNIIIIGNNQANATPNKGKFNNPPKNNITRNTKATMPTTAIGINIVSSYISAMAAEARQTRTNQIARVTGLLIINHTQVCCNIFFFCIASFCYYRNCYKLMV